MAGTTVVDYFTFRFFCKLTDEGDSRALGLLPIMSKYGLLVRTGAGIIILTGVTMLLLSKGIWQQPWFKIKTALVICLFLNGIFAGKKQGLTFRHLMNENGSHVFPNIQAIKANLHIFYLLQLSLFLAIILISMVKIK
jgi:NADH:ubiquinone oxidoreductase subunit 6 (subunit J)